MTVVHIQADFSSEAQKQEHLCKIGNQLYEILIKYIKKTTGNTGGFA